MPALRTVLFLAISAAVSAQSGTDFSGRWKLEPSPELSSEIAHALTVRQSVVSTNVRGEPMTPYFKDIAIEREFADRTRLERHEIGVIGGSVSGSNADKAGDARRRQYGAAKWDSTALVFEDGSHTGHERETGVWSDRREVWSLVSGDRLLVTITTRGSGAAPRTLTLVYRRQ
jgi:hypothetical protein